jgi:hypothetical protein
VSIIYCGNRIYLCSYEYKDAIHEADAHVGAHNNLIDTWWILKLEMLQNVAANGIVFQWSANIIKHGNVIEIKPARAGNGLDYNSHICHALDQILQFDLATSILAAGIQFSQDLSLMMIGMTTTMTSLTKLITCPIFWPTSALFQILEAPDNRSLITFNEPMISNKAGTLSVLHLCNGIYHISTALRSSVEENID